MLGEEVVGITEIAHINPRGGRLADGRWLRIAVIAETCPKIVITLDIETLGAYGFFAALDPIKLAPVERLRRRVALQSCDSPGSTRDPKD